MKLRRKAETYREFGWRWERRYYTPLVPCWQAKRYRSTDDRSRPMLAYECRRPGGVLWAFAGLPRWGR